MGGKWGFFFVFLECLLNHFFYFHLCSIFSSILAFFKVLYFFRIFWLVSLSFFLSSFSLCSYYLFFWALLFLYIYFLVLSYFPICFFYSLFLSLLFFWFIKIVWESLHCFSLMPNILFLSLCLICLHNFFKFILIHQIFLEPLSW